MTFESGKRALFQYSSQTQRKTTCQYITVFIYKNYLFFGLFYIGNLFAFFCIVILIIY